MCCGGVNGYGCSLIGVSDRFELNFKGTICFFLFSFRVPLHEADSEVHRMSDTQIFAQ
jgi:hypothetical protein